MLLFYAFVRINVDDGGSELMDIQVPKIETFEDDLDCLCCEN